MICPSIPRSREFIIVLVYLALFLDNILLTVIVPILPDYLLHQQKNLSIPNSVIYKNFDLHYVPDILTKHHHQRNRHRHHHPHADASAGYSILEKETNYLNLTGEQLRVYKFEEENGSIGILLAIKAFVQLAFNPIVGMATKRLGYRTPVFIGTCCIFVSSIIFAIGEEYFILFFARALQGIGSACIGVCGMSLVAQLYPEEDKRSRIMGVVLGSIALGVLVGYPFGGILYDFFSKSTPFYIIAIILFITAVLQLIMLDFTPIPAPETPVTAGHSNDIKWWPLLTDRLIVLIACAIWISTSAMAILEPCLPIWLLSHLHPKKWQLGTVFIPDSVGYLMGTNFFGSIAYKIGQIKISVMALVLVGVSCVLVKILSFHLKSTNKKYEYQFWVDSKCNNCFGSLDATFWVGIRNWCFRCSTRSAFSSSC